MIDFSDTNFWTVFVGGVVAYFIGFWRGRKWEKGEK
jgi:uncharacterized membrane protein YiaA